MPERVSIIAALGKNRELGKDNKLLWRIPEDLKRFRELTMGHPVVMGRRTFCSILASLGKPLPGRTSIVITREVGWGKPGAVVVNCFEMALRRARALSDQEVFIGGGAQIYEEALPFTHRLYLTLIDEQKDGDVFFPEYEREFTRTLFEKRGVHENVHYRFVTLER